MHNEVCGLRPTLQSAGTPAARRPSPWQRYHSHMSASVSSTARSACSRARKRASMSAALKLLVRWLVNPTSAGTGTPQSASCTSACTVGAKQVRHEGGKKGRAIRNVRATWMNCANSGRRKF